MARKVFVSILGTSNYLQTHYSINGINSDSVRFIQEALADYYCKEWTEEDSILIFLTDEARSRNWEDNGHKNASSEIEKKGLCNILKAKSYGKIVEDKPIPEGTSEKQIWTIFETIYNQLKSDDEVYLDVTHAFRSIPLFTVVLFNYARFMINVQIKTIDYGAFEKLGQPQYVKDIPLENRIAPVIDLTNIIRLQNYTDMASSLSEFGRTAKIMQVFKNDNETAKVLKQIGVAINKFDEYISSNRMRDIEEGKWYNQIINQKKTFKNDNSIPSPIRNVVEKLYFELESYGFEPNNSFSNIEGAIRWAIKYKMLPQAYTMGQEYIITLMTNRLKSYSPFNSENSKKPEKDFRQYVGSLLGIKNKDVEEGKFEHTLNEHISLTKELLGQDVIKNIRPVYQRLTLNRIEIDHAKGIRPFSVMLDEFDKFYGDCISIIKNNWNSRSEDQTTIFLNVSNHNSSIWGEEQKTSASKYGEIVDMPFPNIDSNSSVEDVLALADKYASDIISKYSIASVIHIMGEMTFTYALVKRLREAGFRCVASTTERVKQQLPDGSFISEFRFQSFRDYE